MSFRELIQLEQKEGHTAFSDMLRDHIRRVPTDHPGRAGMIRIAVSAGVKVDDLDASDWEFLTYDLHLPRP